MLATTPDVAVVTGEHAFDVPAFQAALRSVPEIDAYPQSLSNFVADAGDVRDAYDAVVFYHFHQSADPETAAAIERLAETGQGIVVLHHALVAFPEWDAWSTLCGLEDRSFGYSHGETIDVEVATDEHPITAAVGPWTMTDETYDMASPLEEAAHESEVLLTVEHPESMSAVAWTRTYGDARVFCFQSGHDASAFSHPSFRAVLGRGVRWTAGTLDASTQH